MTQTTQTLQASPCKLSSGDWGARVQSETVSAGDVVTITTRGGKSWQASVVTVVSTASGQTIVTTRSLDRAPARRAPARRSSGGHYHRSESECHTDGNCSSICNPKTCPCGNGHWFSCC